MSDKPEIYEIIIRSLTDTISQSERALLETWKGQSRANLLEYTDYETIWNESRKLNAPKTPDINPDWFLIRKKTGIHKSIQIFRWHNAAAVVLLSVLFAGLFHLFTNRRQISGVPETLHQVVSASYGTRSQIRLSDGTLVHLNSGSMLKYPVSFDNQDERTVELVGEALFEVNQTGKPFSVGAGKLTINVTGTRFNVNAYEGNRDIMVALAEGEVKLTRPSAYGRSELATMKPGEVARLNLSENRLYISEEEEIGKHFAWTEGKIVFIDDPILVVVEKLSNWYNVDIDIADRRLDRYRFTGTFIDEPVEQILAILSRTSPMIFNITPSRKLDDNSYTRRKITLRSK